MKSIPLVGKGFEIEPEVCIKLAKRGARIFEVPIRYAARPLYLNYLERVRLDRPYMEVGYTDGEKGEMFPKEKKFDTVICLNVVEHLADDLTALTNFREVLEDRGRAIILVPCGPWLYGSLDEVLGHHRYTRKQLTDLVERAGFQLERMLEFNRAGVIAWWLNARLLRRRTFGFWQIKLLNTMTPVFRVLDGFLPLPPLSLIAVISKPGHEMAETPVRSTLAPVGPA